MNYSPDQWNALQLEVNRQGGALLPDVCEPQDIVFGPEYAKPHKEEKVTCGCGHTTIFVTEYTGEKGKAGFVRACAICDAVGGWGKFQHAMACVE